MKVLSVPNTGSVYSEVLIAFHLFRQVSQAQYWTHERIIDCLSSSMIFHEY